MAARVSVRTPVWVVLVAALLGTVGLAVGRSAADAVERAVERHTAGVRDDEKRRGHPPYGQKVEQLAKELGFLAAGIVVGQAKKGRVYCPAPLSVDQRYTETRSRQERAFQCNLESCQVAKVAKLPQRSGLATCAKNTPFSLAP